MHLQNYFLIAMPLLQYSIFKKSVVYICEYNKNGAIGIIINKPVYKFTFKNILNKLKIAYDDIIPSVYLDNPIFLGVQITDDHCFILHTFSISLL